MIAGQSSRLQLLGHSAADAAGGEQQPVTAFADEVGKKQASGSEIMRNVDFLQVS